MFQKHVNKMLSAYCNKKLAPDESRRVGEHLLTCERCRREYDDINLGVHFAQQLPLVAAPVEMWEEIEAALDERSRMQIAKPPPAKVAFSFSWYRAAAFATVVLIAAAIGIMWSLREVPQSPGPAWDVEKLAGTLRVNGRVRNIGSLAVGETLETDGSSRMKISVGEIGEVDVEPNTRIKLLQAHPTEHRLELERGKMSATISAPPRLFFVNTAAAEAIDMGCQYTLEVDDTGRGLLHVTLGEVALVRDGKEVYVPRYGMCQTRKGIGPGTPYFEGASDAFVQALERFDFENGSDEAFAVVLRESRPRDTFTLWHLLSRVEGNQRSQVMERMIELVGLPKGATREGTMRLDQETLDAWKDAMDTVWF